MILRPTKHSHPDRTVINLSLLILARLSSSRLEDYSALRQFSAKAVVGGEVLLLPALNFLFLLGLVEYRPKTDALEYTGPDKSQAVS